MADDSLSQVIHLPINNCVIITINIIQVFNISIIYIYNVVMIIMTVTFNLNDVSESIFDCKKTIQTYFAIVKVVLPPAQAVSSTPSIQC